MPGVSIFLDVDDLKDIDALEEYVDATAVIMIFVSKGYFKSGNCLREARCTVARSRSRSRSCTTRCKGGAREAATSLAVVIEWHRDFQLGSSSRLLLARSSSGTASRTSTGATVLLNRRRQFRQAGREARQEPP